MLALCGRRSCGEAGNRAGNGLYVDSIGDGADGDRYPPCLNACYQWRDNHMA